MNDSSAVLSSEHHELLRAQRERLPLAAVTAQRNIDAVQADDSAVAGLLKKAGRANRRLKRIRLVLEAASAWAEPVAKHAACKPGCSHCCRIPVAITSGEAAVLAAATGRPMTIPPGARTLRELDIEPDQKPGNVGPCPFLVDGQCAAYDARPSICRLHLNMDADDLLCRIVPDNPAEVPYANKLLIYGHCLVQMEDEVVADIREFFPMEPGRLEPRRGRDA